MRRILLFIIVAVMLLCSCGKQEPEYVFGIPISHEDEVVMDLSTVSYTDEELNAITEYNGSLADYHTNYKVECIRRIGEWFRVAYLGENKVALVFFYEDGTKIAGFQYGLYNKKADFQELKIGMELQDVLEIDPNGYYPINGPGSIVIRESDHYTVDGYRITIYYADDSDTIEEIITDLI